MSETSSQFQQPVVSRVDPEDKSAIQGMFSVIVEQLYQQPLISCLREIISNALDASVASNASCIDLRYSSETNCFSIRDYGFGMSPEFMTNHYSKVFSSSKKRDSTQIGSYGIGRLSVLAYRSSFFLNTIYEGVKYKYKVHLLDKIPSHVLLDSYSTEEPSGTEVVIPEVRKTSLGDACGLLIKQATYSKITYNFQQELSPLQDFVKNNTERICFSGKTWSLNNNSDHKSFNVGLYVDGVFYKVNSSLLSKTDIASEGYYNKERMLPTLPIPQTEREYPFKDFSFMNHLLELEFFNNKSKATESQYLTKERLNLFTTTEEVELTSSREGLIASPKTIETLNRLYYNFVFEFLESVQNNDYSFEKVAKENDSDFYHALLNLEVLSINGYKIVPETESLNYKYSKGKLYNDIEYSGRDLPSQEKVPYKIKLSKFINSIFIYFIRKNEENPSRISYISPYTNPKGENVSSSFDSSKTLKLSEIFNLKFVLLVQPNGISPSKFIEKHGIDSKGKDILIIRESSSLDVHEVFKPLISLKNMGVLDIDYIESKESEIATTKKSSKSTQIKPNLKSTRRMIQRIKSKNTASLILSSRKINENNKVKFLFGNNNNDNLLQYNELSNIAYYVKKSQMSLDFLNLYCNDSLFFKNYEDIYLLSDSYSEKLVEMLKTNTSTEWRNFSQLLDDKISNALAEDYRKYRVYDEVIDNVSNNLHYYELLNYLVILLSFQRHSDVIIKHFSMKEVDIVKNFFSLNEVFKTIAQNKGYYYNSRLSNLISSFYNKDMLRLDKNFKSNFLNSIEDIVKHISESNFQYFGKVRYELFEEDNNEVETCNNLLSCVYERSMIESYRTISDVSYKILDKVRYRDFCYCFDQIKRIIEEYV